MQCMDGGAITCESMANQICHRCDKQICHGHTLNLHIQAGSGARSTQSTCRACAESIVASLTDELDNLRMKLALAFQQADYWSEHLITGNAPTT